MNYVNFAKPMGNTKHYLQLHFFKEINNDRSFPF